MTTTSVHNETAPKPGAGDRVQAGETAARERVLVDPDWLAAHLHDPGIRVVEVDVSPAAFDDWHIETAVLWNVYSDLKDTSYRLAGPAAVQRVFERSGIGPGSTVVFYGYAPAMGFWLMKLYGHADARILDCSRDTWRAEGRPSSGATAPTPATSYRLGGQDRRLRAGQAEVQQAIADPETTIADTRTRPEYDGERFWPSGGQEPGGRAGHIPTAAHQPLEDGDIYDERGSFRSTADLRAAFPAIDLAGTGELITYCTIGGRACKAWFVLSYLLGREHVRVYDGSWAQWGREPAAPVERAQAAG